MCLWSSLNTGLGTAWRQRQNFASNALSAQFQPKKRKSIFYVLYLPFVHEKVNSREWGVNRHNTVFIFVSFPKKKKILNPFILWVFVPQSIWNFHAEDLSLPYSKQSVLPGGGKLPLMGGVLEVRDWWAAAALEAKPTGPPMWVPDITGALIWLRGEVIVVTAWGMGGGK